MTLGKTYKAPSMPVKDKPKKTQEDMAKLLAGDTKQRVTKHKL